MEKGRSRQFIEAEAAWESSAHEPVIGGLSGAVERQRPPLRRPSPEEPTPYYASVRFRPLREISPKGRYVRISLTLNSTLKVLKALAIGEAENT